MPERGYSLTREDATRVGRAVTFAERFSREGVNVTPLPGLQPGNTSEPILWPVEVVGEADPPGPAGLLVGLLWLPDPSTDPPWRSEACWVREVPGHPLAAGDSGMARCVGWEAAVGPYDALPVYSLLCCGAGVEGFHARLVSGSGGGPWVVQPIARDTSAWVDVGSALSNAYCKAWEDATTPAPEAGDVVWVKRSEEDPDRYEFVSHPNFDCGITHDPATDTYSVDLAAVAGDGLEVQADEPCDRLAVGVGCGLEVDGDGKVAVDLTALVGPGLQENATPPCNELMVKTGCGLGIDGDGAVALVLTDVVFDGLYFDDGLCALGVNYGCGLTLSGDELVVDVAGLAGEASLTGLVTHTGGCTSLGVDLAVASTTTETVVTDAELTIEGTSACLTLTKVTYTNEFNAAGLLVGRTAGSPATESGGCVDVCEPCDGILTECCEELIPTELIITVSGGTGTCTGLPATIALTYSDDVSGGGGPGWESAAVMGQTFRLRCVEGVWALSWDASDIIDLGTASCDPFEVVFNGNDMNTCTGDATFTVTAP